MSIDRPGWLFTRSPKLVDGVGGLQTGQAVTRRAPARQHGGVGASGALELWRSSLRRRSRLRENRFDRDLPAAL